jgi:hypothetical protein
LAGAHIGIGSTKATAVPSDKRLSACEASTGAYQQEGSSMKNAEGAAIALYLVLFAQQAFAADITANGVITGQMHIDFNTRNSAYRDTEQARDIYTIVDSAPLKVLPGTECEIDYKGTIIRQPPIKRMLEMLGNKQEAGYKFELEILHPQAGSIGTWSGFNYVNEDGIYIPEKGKNTVTLTKGKITGSFPLRGLLIGKKPKGVRRSGFQKTAPPSPAANIDVIGFKDLLIPGGPNYACARDIVINGNLVYNYATETWDPKGLRIKDIAAKKDDVIGGNIKWNDNGHGGSYEFNLIFGARQALTNGKATDQFGSVETKPGDATTAVDSSIPTLAGTITYEDVTVPLLSKDGKPILTPKGEQVKITQSSDVIYNLNARKLTSHQIFSLFKLLMVGIGPMNDD